MKAAIAITFIFLVSCASPIDRRKVVERHNVTICATDSLSPAQVGNGHFAFGMDITGLQTFVPFNTLADWIPEGRGRHVAGIPRRAGRGVGQDRAYGIS